MNPPDKPNLRDLRVSYELGELDESSAPASPLDLFQTWLHEALANQLPEPNAMTLATIGLDGAPTARTVLLKQLDDRGFCFFTNYDSRKGSELASDPRAAMVFLWTDMQRQVSIRGTVKKLPQAEAESYFAVRPYGHQIGAWASQQSAEIDSRDVLETKAAALRERYPEGHSTVPCPPHWGGYALMPEEIEFWQGRRSRLHDRLRYRREGDAWVRVRLSP